MKGVIERKEGFPPSSLNDPVIFSLMHVKTLQNESRGENGTHGS
jgi:hypothetical protein